MFRIYSKKGFRIWVSILLIFIIVLGVFACSIQEASAFAIAIPPLAYYVLGASLLALGVANWQGEDGLGEFIVYEWNHMSEWNKKRLTELKLLAGQGFKLGADLFNEIKSLVYDRVDSVALKNAIETGENTEVENIFNSGVFNFTLEGFSQEYSVTGSGSITRIIYLSELLGDAYGYEGSNPAYLQYTYNTYNPDFYGLNQIILYYPVAIGYPPNSDVYQARPIASSYTGGVYFPDEWILDGNNLQVNSYTYGSAPGLLYQTFDITIQPHGGYNYVPDVVDKSYTIEPEYIPGSVVDGLVADGVVDAGDVSSNVGTESIDGDTVFVYPQDYQELQDLINLQAQDILDMQRDIDILTDLSTGEITSDAEIVGEGAGTGVFGDIGKWILNIPILGVIVQMLANILQSIQGLTAVSDFTLDFSPLKIGLTEVFPFCIPFDLLRMVTVYAATPDDFVFDIELETEYFDIEHEVDLTPFSIPIIFFRWIVTIWFSWILISRTRDMIKW